ncbi:MAG: hypothetical protein Q9180_008554, partial [Flavoplaca navasiana]
NLSQAQLEYINIQRDAVPTVQPYEGMITRARAKAKSAPVEVVGSLTINVPGEDEAWVFTKHLADPGLKEALDHIGEKNNGKQGKPGKKGKKGKKGQKGRSGQ